MFKEYKGLNIKMLYPGCVLRFLVKFDDVNKKDRTCTEKLFDMIILNVEPEKVKLLGVNTNYRKNIDVECLNEFKATEKEKIEYYKGKPYKGLSDKEDFYLRIGLKSPANIINRIIAVFNQCTDNQINDYLATYIIPAENFDSENEINYKFWDRLTVEVLNPTRYGDLLIEYKGFNLDKITPGTSIVFTNENEKLLLMTVLEVNTTKIKVLGINAYNVLEARNYNEGYYMEYLRTHGIHADKNKVYKLCEEIERFMLKDEQYKPLAVYSLPIVVFNKIGLDIERR